jgi:hypothetical protein
MFAEGSKTLAMAAVGPASSAISHHDDPPCTEYEHSNSRCVDAGIITLVPGVWCV